MVIKSDTTYKNLRKKGFKDAPGDHKFLEFHHNGKFITRTKMSHGATHAGRPTDQQNVLSVQIRKRDFLDLANCPLSQDGYIRILLQKGEIV